MLPSWLPKSLLQRLRQVTYLAGYALACAAHKPEPGTVLFLSDSNATLTGNQEVLARELTERGYTVRTSLKGGLAVRRTRAQQIALCIDLAKAPVIIVDDYFPMIYQLKLRKGTQLLQVWHASGAFKRMGFSRVGKPGGPVKGSRTHKNYTAAIVSSSAIRENYAEAFGISLDKVHATGIPRTDVFFDTQYIENARTEVRQELDIPADKKLLLFAPTFRGNGQMSAYYDPTWIDWEQLAQKVGPHYIIGYKAHPFVKDKPEIVTNDPRFRDLGSIRDTNRLLMATDLLVTDYSSIIFDFALLGRPTVFFCPDLEEYVAARDFYYPYDRYTFGPVARTWEQLAQHVTADAPRSASYDEFVEFFCGACDGASTARVIDELIAPYTLDSSSTSTVKGS